MFCQKVTIVGVGLLGGSLGQALRERRLAATVCGFVRRSKSATECRNAGAADEATTDLQQAVTGAELIILCTPVASMRSLLKHMAPWLKPGCIITDVGSVKAKVVKELEPVARRAGAYFIGSHPMAGSEQCGVAAARSNLFEGSTCVVTPTVHSNRRALRQVESLWKAVGGTVLRLTPEKHDKIVSRTSHLPYFTAAAMSRLVLDPSRPAEQPRLCAGGFRDSTRVASGSPEMWRDIALANRREVAQAMAVLIRDLQQLRKVILQANPRALEKRLLEAKKLRDGWRAGVSSLQT